jgi:DNA-binding beta-propeller fold protein YncE
VSSQASSPQGLAFKPDGTKMYVANYNTGVYEYNLSTGFDLSTASYNQFGAKDSGQTSQISSISFSPNGDKAWIVDYGNDDIDEYDLSTAWDISTLSYSRSFSVASQATLPTFVIFKTDGSKMYVMDSITDTVYQYTTGSTATATFTYPSSVKFPNGTAPAGPAIGETDVLVFYTDDGGTTYQGFRAGNAMS